jgi:hypothetical protein
MRALLGLAFLLGLISVIVPLKFIGISTRKRGLLVMVAAFGLIAIYGLIFDPPSNNNNNRQATSSKVNVASASARSSNSIASSAIESKWRYSEEEDKMRNQTTRFAALDSDNALSFDFPYNGGSTGELTLRISPKFGKDAVLQVSKGQFLCTFEGCTVHVKFDNQPIVSYSAAEAADGRSDMIFIHNYAGLVQHLKHAKTIMIEAEFYREGWRQLEFSPVGLNW